MIRRFLTRFLLVILIAFCAYNWWQVHQLQRQVDVLSNRLAVKPPADPLAAKSLDWPAAQRHLQVLQAEVKALQSQADDYWQRGHSLHKLSVSSP